MKHPVEGKPVSMKDYFKGTMTTHMVGILGGVVWCVGQSFSMIASEKLVRPFLMDLDKGQL